MILYYDTQSAIHITVNSIFHERIKHIKVDIARERIGKKEIKMVYVSFENRIGDIIIKMLGEIIFR